MARSHYIYLVCWKEPGQPSHEKVMAGFTVKYEAQHWATNLSGHPLERLQLSRMRDGTCYPKAKEDIPWDTT